MSCARLCPPRAKNPRCFAGIVFLKDLKASTSDGEMANRPQNIKTHRSLQ